MSDIAIEVDSLWKRFHRGEYHDSLRDFIPALARRLTGRGPKRDELAEGDFWALKDVSFQVRQGEVLGIIGSNGAGKSTLLKILAKILKPNRGHVRVNGRLRALIEVAAGFHGDLTGRENIYLNGTIMGMKKREIDAKFDEIVEFSGIADFLDTPVKRYSSGMHARLGFAVAAHLEPEILLIDEVLAVGDAEFQKKCLGKMDDVAKAGRTVLFISHNMVAQTSLCPKVLWLASGSVVQIGSAADVVADYLGSAERVGSAGARDVKGLGDPSPDLFARVVQVELRNSYGQLSNKFAIGEPIQVVLTLQSDRPVLGEVGYTVRTSEGVPLWTSSSNDFGEMLPIGSGTTSVSSTIAPNHLCAGWYVLSVGTTYACRSHVITKAIDFEVLPNRHYSQGSLYNLPGHLHFLYKWEVIALK